MNWYNKSKPKVEVGDFIQRIRAPFFAGTVEEIIYEDEREVGAVVDSVYPIQDNNYSKVNLSMDSFEISERKDRTLRFRLIPDFTTQKHDINKVINFVNINLANLIKNALRRIPNRESTFSFGPILRISYINFDLDIKMSLHDYQVLAIEDKLENELRTISTSFSSHNNMRELLEERKPTEVVNFTIRLYQVGVDLLEARD